MSGTFSIDSGECSGAEGTFSAQRNDEGSSDIQTGLYEGTDVSFVVQSPATSSSLGTESAQSHSGEVITATSTTYEDNRRGYKEEREGNESDRLIATADASSTVSDLELSYSGSASGSYCSFTYESTVEFGADMEIVDGSFSYSSSSYEVSGTFDDSGSVSINLSWSQYNSYCKVTYSGSRTYTASYAGGVGTVEGTVTDASTGTALSLANVIIGDESDTTGADGTYSISKLRAGDYTITATQIGYGSYSGTVTVIADATSTADIQLSSSSGGGGGGNNTAPVASAGPDQNVTTGSLVTLDGSGSSDADGDTLTYWWSMLIPFGSSATLSDATAVSPTFTPDVDGIYLVSLTVNDGTVDSALDIVMITASP